MILLFLCLFYLKKSVLNISKIWELEKDYTYIRNNIGSEQLKNTEDHCITNCMFTLPLPWDAEFVHAIIIQG